MVLSDGVDDSWFVMPEDRPIGGPNFLFIGRQEPFQKGLDLLVAAIDRVTAAGQFPQARFKIAGPSTPPMANVLGQSNAYRSGLIDVVGEVSGTDKQELFAWAHYFLHPSRYEGMAKAPREALAQGVPIIASRESNLGDWAVDAHFGLVCELSVESLAEAISAACIGHAELHGQMSAAAREFAESQRWPRIAQRLDRFLVASSIAI